ncbi:MAG: hypothetical protein HN683_23985 [Gammaproteobacteria bacterium]|nr:hypothetical protein [Gammaproteobacteria bacterium]
MDRITEKDLKRQLKVLNALTGHKETPFEEVNGAYVWNTGTYCLGMAYGGCRIEQIVNSGGGCSDVSMRGTRREVYEQLRTAVRVLSDYQAAE